MPVINSLSDLTIEFNEFRTQFYQAVSNKPTWRGQLVTQTSQTLIDMVSTIGVFDQEKIRRVYEDAFAETAQSDGAIRAITQMQGIRMSRKLPAEITVRLTASSALSINPYTEFGVAGSKYFCRESISFTAGQTKDVVIYQGQIQTLLMNGLGTDHQTFVSEELGFSVSDLDVNVRVNNVLVQKSYGGLWNYKGLPAYSDMTLPDGRLLIVFGTSIFGSVPQVNDVVTVSYAVTDGDNSNNKVTIDRRVTVDGVEQLTGVALTNPTGGSDEKSILIYKNISSGSFGTNQSAVTKTHYVTIVNTYPGIIDAITQAQREIDPYDLEWMNVIRVSALTNSPWTQNQKRTFTREMEKVSMYSSRFVFQEPIPIDRDLDIEVYIFNTAVTSTVKQRTEEALTYLFEPKPGILMTDLFESDISRAITNASPGHVSHIISNVHEPMLVSPPPSPDINYTVNSTGGQLDERAYSYSVATKIDGEWGTPHNWVFPQTTGTSSTIKLDWEAVTNAEGYRVYGRTGEDLGLLIEVAANVTTWTDNGVLNPTGGRPNTLNLGKVKYNRLRSLTVTVKYANRQQRIGNQQPERLI